MNRPVLSRRFFAFILLTVPLVARADAPLQELLEQTLATAREVHDLPAVAALIQIDGKIEAEAALGTRALGHPQAVTVDDRWHIGSDTKAFTSTLIARLVERGVMYFEDTLETSFPGFAKDMDPAYRRITVKQLLSSTSGLPPLTDDKDLAAFLAVIEPESGVMAQRSAIARHYLTQPPASAAGEFAYSNLGFIIAAAIAQARTGKSWEDLVREQVFEPLGIANVGFGAPGTPGQFDQPQGHQETAGSLMPLDPADAQGDNPPALGPAGTMHIALKDWMLFAQDQLDGVHGHGKLLEAETYRLLHTPVAGSYALGWGAKLEPDGVPMILAHTGSNGFWLADVRIMPRRNIIILIAINAGNEAANQAIQEIGKSLRDRLKPYGCGSPQELCADFRQPAPESSAP